MKHLTEHSEKLTMRQMPKGEGPYERCMEKGAEVLSDAELLAVIIRTGSREDTSEELAQKLLKSGGEEGLSGLAHHSFEEFTKIRGIGKVKAAQLLCIFELSRRIWRNSVQRAEQLLPRAVPDCRLLYAVSPPSGSGAYLRHVF